MAKYLKSLKFPNSDTAYKLAEEQYNPDSEYAQSGKAVAEAVAPKADKTEVDQLKGDLANLNKSVKISNQYDRRYV